MNQRSLARLPPRRWCPLKPEDIVSDVETPRIQPIRRKMRRQSTRRRIKAAHRRLQRVLVRKQAYADFLEFNDSSSTSSESSGDHSDNDTRAIRSSPMSLKINNYNNSEDMTAGSLLPAAEILHAATNNQDTTNKNGEGVQVEIQIPMHRQKQEEENLPPLKTGLDVSRMKAASQTQWARWTV